MSTSLCRLMILLLWFPLTSSGQDTVSTPSNPTQEVHGQYQSGFRILSEVRETERGGYTDGLLSRIRQKWYRAIPDLQKTGEMRRGITRIEFEITRNGTVEKLNTIAHAPRPSLDDAARDAIATAGPFGPLPESLGKVLKVEMEFGYDQPGDPGVPFCNGPNLGAHPSAGEPLHEVRNGVQAPRAKYSPVPEYSEDARREKYQSNVMIAGTVQRDGRFSDLCLTQAAGHGLDQKSMEAVGTWTFEPATESGEPVAVRLQVETGFHLY